MDILIDFCGGCGIQLPSNMGNWPDAEQVCHNCSSLVKLRCDRLQGNFSEEDGKRLIALLEGEEAK